MTLAAPVIFEATVIPADAAPNSYAELNAPASIALSDDEQMAFTAARSASTIAGYTRFLTQFPSGRFAQEVRLMRDRLIAERAASVIEALPPSSRAIVARARQTAVQASAYAAAASALRGAQSTGALTVLILQDGWAYEGQPPQGRNRGLGRAFSPAGDYYAGEWRNNTPDGFGVVIYAGGVRFEGRVANGSPTSDGLFTDEAGQPLSANQVFTSMLTSQRVTARSWQ